MEDVILYHGSRGGIIGDIKPKSRIACDFGEGFYLCTNPMQAKGIIVEDSCPVFYEIKLKLSEIPEDRILNLNGQDWVLAVLANRRRLKDINDSWIGPYWINRLQEFDVVIGPIADDRMNEAMRRFSDYGLTDKGLEACLKSVNYGTQYVLKSNLACSKVEIINEHEIFGQEADHVHAYTKSMRNEGRDVVNRMAAKYMRDGRYLNEMLKELHTDIPSRIPVSSPQPYQEETREYGKEDAYEPEL